MKSVCRIEGQGKVKDVDPRALAEYPAVEGVDATVACIQALIPLGLQATEEALTAEVTRLAGSRHSRTGRRPGYVRWSRERGSVYLWDQKLPIAYTRVRDRLRNQEVPLATYQQLLQPHQADIGLFRKVPLGLSCRNYAACAEAVPEAFGLSASTVSRRFIRASAKTLRQLHERYLAGYNFVALVLDGKTCGADHLWSPW